MLAALAILKNLPWRVIAILALIVGCALLCWESGARHVQIRWDAANLTQAKAVARDQAAARAEEVRRAAAQKEVTDETQRLAASARAAASGADAAGQRLRDRFADAAAGCQAPSNPDPSAVGPPAGATAAVLDDVFSRIDRAAGELAAYADQSRIAGLACQRSYDALTPP